MTDANQDSVYLPGLNALRFFAAFLVIITHIELLKLQLGFSNSWEFLEQFNLGGLGVYFFFVLSGYLITYLLIHEKEKTGTINIKAFYVRRLLRIWPLYYLITLLAFFILPNFEMMQVPWLEQFYESNFTINLVLFLFMFPNLAFALNPAVAHAGQLWSIGVEEQFYLIWPVIFKKTKNLLRLLILLFTIVVGIKVLFILLLNSNTISSSESMLALKKFMAMSKFECMIIGAFGAYWIKSQSTQILSIICHPLVFGVALISLPLMNYFSPEILNDAIHLPYSFMFIVIILNVSINKTGLLLLENKLFNFLGKISYGLYMYHMIIVVFVIQMIAKIHGEIGVKENILIYFCSVSFSILVAWLSYEYFEKPFLKLKSKFTIVKSGKI